MNTVLSDKEKLLPSHLLGDWLNPNMETVSVREIINGDVFCSDNNSYAMSDFGTILKRSDSLIGEGLPNPFAVKINKSDINKGLETDELIRSKPEPKKSDSLDELLVCDTEQHFEPKQHTEPVKLATAKRSPEDEIIISAIRVQKANRSTTVLEQIPVTLDFDMNNIVDVAKIFNLPMDKVVDVVFEHVDKEVLLNAVKSAFVDKFSELGESEPLEFPDELL